MRRVNGILRGVQVASSRRRRSCTTNSKSEDISLQTNRLHCSAIHSGVLKIVTHLAWEHIRNAIICAVASSSYPFVFLFIMRSWEYIYSTVCASLSNGLVCLTSVELT